MGVAICWVNASGVLTRGAEPPAGEPKTHTLFMGMDFDVQQGKELHRVTDVVGGSFILRIDGKIVRVPVFGNVALRITQELKLAAISADVKDLKVERAYTPENDPHRKWMEAQSMMVDATSNNVQNSIRAQATTLAGLGMAMSLADKRSPKSSDAAVIQAQADVARATRNLDNSSAMGHAMSNPAFYTQKMEEELRQELFDAVDVHFQVSSARPLANPYVVVVVQFHAPNAPNEMAQNWIYAEAIERLDAQPQTFHIKRGGFPPGYELQRFQVHVYDKGREVASNVAPKRVALTSSEAYEYLLIEHLAAHKGKDASAAVALGNLPADLRQKLPVGELGRTFYAKVNKEGVATAVFTDEACENVVENADTASVIKGIRFLPALAKGVPVDGVAKVKLTSIPI
jgi:hypothetical protein